MKIKFQPLMFPVSPCLPQYTIISCKHSEKTIVYFPKYKLAIFEAHYYTSMAIIQIMLKLTPLSYLTRAAICRSIFFVFS